MMSDHPKIGMHYEDVRKRLKKYESIKKYNNTNLRDSLVRQAMLHEGGDAGTELLKEHFSDCSQDMNNHSKGRVGYSPLYSDRFQHIKW